MGQCIATIDALASWHIDVPVRRPAPADFRPLALDVEQEDALIAEHPRIHQGSIAQKKLNVLETDKTEIGKASHYNHVSKPSTVLLVSR